MAKKTANEKKLRITQVKSAIGYSEKHKATLRALGFHHIGETVELVDSSALQGMLRKVNHLVKIEEQEAK
jgi:large subunit ribosomal protein L30